RAYPGRRAPVFEPLRAGARATVAHAAPAADAEARPGHRRPVRVRLRGHRDRGLRAAARDQGAGGGVTALSLLAALDREFAIGKDGALPWHLPDDLKRFKSLTLGKPVLMGRKTAEALGRALPGRRNRALTRSGTVPFEGMEAVGSLEAALQAAKDASELWVIGGGEVFAETLPLA